MSRKALQESNTEYPRDEEDMNGEAPVFRKDGFLRYNDPVLELQFTEFLRPRVSASLVLFLLMFVVAYIILFRNAEGLISGHGALPVLIGIAAIVVMVLATVWQVAIALVHRCFAKVRVGALNQQSEWLMVAVALFSGLAAGVYTTYGTTDREGCTARLRFVYKSNGDHGYYDEALCERQLTSISAILALLLAVRRQRLISLVILTILVLSANVVFALFLPKHRSFPAYHWLAMVFNSGMLGFACVVRYTLESDERRYFETHVRLRSEQQLLEKLSAEDEAFVATLLPPTIVSRSARGNATKVDSADDAVVLVVSVADFTNVAGKMLAMELYTQLRCLQRAAIGHAMKGGLHKMLSLNDELVLVSNLIDRRHPLHALINAVEAALASTEPSTVMELRLRAAVHTGPLKGGFHGGNWIRYDVWGPALDEARAASHHAVASQVILTDDAYRGCSGHAVVREGPSAVCESKSTAALLWVVESCAPLDSLVIVPPLMTLTDSSGTAEAPYLKSSQTESNSDTFVNPLSRLVRAEAAIKAAAAADTELPEESTWLIFHRFIQPEVEAEYLRVRMVAMTQRATRVWLAFAWLQLVFVVILMADFFPHSGELTLILLCLSIALTLAVALMPMMLTSDRMYAYHTPWSLLALLTPLLTTLAIASSRPSALGIDPRSMMMVGALLRVPCLYHERHQLIVIPAFILLSLSSYLLPGSGLSVWTFPFIAGALYVIVTSSESDHAQRQNYVEKKQLLLTLEALEQQRHLRRGLVRATLPAPVLDAWCAGNLRLGIGTASQVPDTLGVCVSVRQAIDDLVPGARPHHLGYTTDRLRPVERAAEKSGVLHIVEVVGDLCVLVSPVVLPGQDHDSKTRATLEALPEVLSALLELCSSGLYGALMDIDTTIQVLSTVGLPSYSIFGLLMTRLIGIATATANSWRGVCTLERNVAVIRASSGDAQVEEQPQPPLRIRGIGMLRLVRLS